MIRKISLALMLLVLLPASLALITQDDWDGDGVENDEDYFPNDYSRSEVRIFQPDNNHLSNQVQIFDPQLAVHQSLDHISLINKDKILFTADNEVFYLTYLNNEVTLQTILPEDFDDDRWVQQYFSSFIDADEKLDHLFLTLNPHSGSNQLVQYEENSNHLYIFSTGNIQF